jgi:GNAT superfamily N-acetyltransferase
MFNDPPLIVALDHPSLIDAIDQFADELRSEQRFFGPNAAPAPFPSLINRVTSAGGTRLGAMIDGQIVAMARVEASGDTSIAVVADWRGRGVGRTLLTATVRRAGQLGISRLVLRSSLRSRSVAALGASVGAVTIDQGRGRVDLIFPTDFSTRTA